MELKQVSEQFFSRENQLFGITKNFQKCFKKRKKAVDKGGENVVFYPSARKKGIGRAPEGRRGNLENDTERLRKKRQLILK